MLRTFTLTALTLISSLSFAQNPIFEAVQTAKNSSITFKNTKPLAEKGSISKNGKFQTSLSEGVLFEMNKTSLTKLTNEKNEALRFEIEKGEGKKPLVLELVKTELLGSDFRVLTDNSPNKGVDYNSGIHYRGIVSGDRNSVVALSIYNGEMMSVINSAASGNLVLGKTSNEGEEYILYNPADATEKPPFDCGTADVPLTQEQIDGMLNYQNTANKVDNCVNVFLEVDYTLVSEKGGRQAAINYVTGLFNVVATLYQAEEITVKISEMFVWESEDPYAASSSIDALLLFRDTRKNFNGDLAHLISRGAPAGGGVAWVNSLCTSYNYAYSYVFNSYNQLPSYSWSVNVIAHEMGHNLGSPHTHACAWNGNNTALDGCGAQAGYSEGCDGPIPTNGGTVMSYCHLLSGVGINMNNGFGQQPGDLIRNSINNASCLTTCNNTPPPPPVTACQTISITKDDSRCFGEADGTVKVNIIDGTAPFNIQWSNGMTADSIDNLLAGNYSVVVIDANNCIDTASTTILQPSAIKLKTTVINESFPGANDGKISVTASGGIPPYSYRWATGSTTQSQNDLSAGNYSVVVTDANYCSSFFAGTVTVLTNCPTLAISKTDLTCFNAKNGTATVTGTGGITPYSYLWSNGQTTATATVLDAGTHTVYVTDRNKCQVETSVSIEAPSQLLVSGIVSDETIAGSENGNINLAVSGGTPPYSFLWSDGSTGQNLTNKPAGNYWVEVFDANQCVTVYQGTIDGGAACPTLSVSTTNVNCFGKNDGTATLKIDGGTAPFIIEWSSGNSSQTAFGLTAGNHSVIIRDANDCVVETGFEIEQPNALEISGKITNETLAGNNDGKIDLEVSGGTMPYTFDWSNNSNNQNQSGLAAGNYSVVVTDANGCAATFSGTIQDGATCHLISIEKTNVTCAGSKDGTAFLKIENGTAPFQVFWSDSSNLINRTGLAAGNYSVIVLDANGCQSTSYTTIQEPSELVASGNSVNESAPGVGDGSIKISVTGGTPPYQYLWSTGANGERSDNLTAGDYWVEVFDANQCLTVFQFSIESDIPCHEIAIETSNASCFDSNDGTAEISISGGTAPFEIQWSNGINSNMNAGLAPGDYSVIVMDATGCFAEAKTTIKAPDQITVFGQSTNESAPDETDGEISLNITGGTLPYSFKWSNGSTEQNLSNVTGGDYSVIITDANGCSVSYSETIETNVICHEITVEKANASCFDSNDGSASVSISGGLAPFSIEWSHGATGVNTDDLEPGEYQVFVFDAAGYFASASFKIEAPEALVIKLEKTNLSEEGANDGKVNLTVSGGTAPYSIEWSNGSTSEDLTDLEVGFYEVIVTDAMGCFEAAEVEITGPVSFNCTPLVQIPSYQGFEKGWKEWTQESADGVKWSLKSGKTPTRKTGPNKAKKGKIYSYMEASGNNNKSASLISPCYDLSGTISPKLTFAYHMKGIDQGALSVEISTDAGETWEDEIFNLDGQQGGGWKIAVVDLMPYSFQTIKVRITGTIGDGNKSDIALDRIRITDQGSTLPSTKEADGLVNLRNLALAPNPVIDWVVIEFESAQSSEITISILNMLGKPVRREVVQTVLGRNALEIDLGDLEGGYYFVNITDGNRFLSEKLVKVKW